MLKEQIKEYCQTLGLDTLGFIPCRVYEELIPFYKKRQEEQLENEFEDSDINKRINPTMYLESAQTILSIAFPYEDNLIKEHGSKGFSSYTKRKDYHQVVGSYLNLICDKIREWGGEAIGLVDSHGLPERYIASLAGVGFIGKNNMLITKKYGSYVFLGEILMSFKLDCEEQTTFQDIQNYVQCGCCEKCRRVCPTCALEATAINPNRCLSYLTQKKELDNEQMRQLKGRLFGCDTCQEGCPHNVKRGVSPLEAFKTLPHMEEDNRVYAAMDNQYFKEQMKQTSAGWRGKNVLRRNAIIAMKEAGQSITHLKGESGYINAYIQRLDNQKNE